MKGCALLVGIILAFSAPVLGNAWVTRYSGPGSGYDEAYALAVDSSGNVYVTGVSNENYLTVKYDPNGDEVWESICNGPSDGYDMARAIAIDNASGSVYVTGSSYDDSNLDDYLTIKYRASDGCELWTARYNGTGYDGDYAYAIAVSPAGNVYVTGTSVGTDANMSYDYATVKYNSSGVQQWINRYNNSSQNDWDMAYAIAVDSAGNAYVTGTSAGSTTGSDFYTVKYYNSGSQHWAKRWPTSGNTYDVAYAIVIDDSNNVYIAGESDGNYATIKYNSSGTLQWSRIYNGDADGYDCPFAIAVDGSGNVYVTGQSYSDANGSDYATVKYNSGGTQQWVAFYDGPVSGSDYARAIAIDGSGNVYVTGQSFGGEVIWDDYATVKYNSDGTQQWAARYNGPGHNYDNATDIAVDGAGNVYVTGFSYGSGSNTDFATIKNPDQIGYCAGPIVGDFNSDCVVDLADFSEFAANWLKSNIQ